MGDTSAVFRHRVQRSSTSLFRNSWKPRNRSSKHRNRQMRSVDGYRLPLENVSPCEYSSTTPHGVGITRVIQIATRRKEDRTRLKVEFTEVPTFIVRKQP